MSITLNRFAIGDTNYVNRHNANCDALESAVNSLQSQVTGSAGSALSAGTGFEALYGVSVAVIGIGSYQCTGAGTELTVAPGYAWLAGEQLVVQKLAATTISFSGVAAGTYYIIVSTRPGPEGNAVGSGRRPQGPERAIRIAVVEIGHALLFDEEALARQELHPVPPKSITSL